MLRWLVALSGTSLLAATQANAQAALDFADENARVASSRIIDLRLSQPLGSERPAPLISELLVNQQVSSNAAFGLGLANFYSRRKAAANWRVGDGTAARARKPAVTFLLKF